MRNLLIILIFFYLPFSYGQKPKNIDLGNESFSFVFMTDIHLQPEKNVVQAFHMAIDSVNHLNPDFVITGGDNIMDALGQSWGRSDNLYTLFDSILKEFNSPVYTTLGNHDIFGLYLKSGINPDHPEYGKKMYENRRCKRYYSFDHKNWHFIILDGIGFTEDRGYFGYVDPEQMEWLKKDLQKTGTATPVVVSIHIPLMSVESQIALGPTEAFKKNSIVNNANEVRKVFYGYNIKLVLQGHTHFLEDIYYDGIHYITGGAVSGAVWNGPRNKMKEGFLLLKVRNDGFVWKYIDYGWKNKDLILSLPQ